MNDDRWHRFYSYTVIPSLEHYLRKLMEELTIRSLKTLEVDI